MVQLYNLVFNDFAAALEDEVVVIPSLVAPTTISITLPPTPRLKKRRMEAGQGSRTKLATAT